MSPKPRASATRFLSEQALGLEAGFAAFILWGALPLYFSLFDPAISPWEILAHRVLWSAILLGLATLLLGRAERLRAVFTTPALLGSLALSALLVSINWGTFIWAVVNGRVIDASLGYFINPLLSIALGFLFFGERLHGAQWVAVMIAVAGVLFSIIAYGHVPWVGLTLAFSFGFYGLVRKQVKVDSLTGLLVETLLLSPPCLILLGWFYAHDEAFFALGSMTTDLLLVGGGVMTVLPFTLFAAGVKRLRLGTIGLMQYITPTLQFLSGVILLHEPLPRAELVTFACIWVALALYTLSLLNIDRRRTRRARPL